MRVMTPPHCRMCAWISSMLASALNIKEPLLKSGSESLHL